ncbi:hypothetical protein H6F67_24965 [Microcoleus sp. FACHB-1515]|uniref:hypothetical protein n=1 Tax=Cyanophyceae TaxID=3028117 RepID=UPI0016896989|nr:hypothetical protein [Microcoleus sp. FACHB-1515]MBD2093102.1 hypothetical protein [Microcoleus sp. FACHB-1515]
MRTDLDFRDRSLFGSVVFRSTFNRFEPITATQAWSLFFTASREDKALGFNPELGRFFNYLLLAIVTTGILWSVWFRPL